MEIRHPGALAVLAVVGLAALVAAIAIGGSGDLSMTRVSAEPLSEVSPNLVVAEQYTVGVGPYYGLGAWVDSYDADPAYTSGRPSVRPCSCRLHALTTGQPGQPPTRGFWQSF